MRHALWWNIGGAVCAALAAAAIAAENAGNTQGPKNDQAQIERELIPGAERMTSAEREAYRKRMQEAKTPEEKAKIRAEYAKAAGAKPPEGALVGDPARGASLHRGCFGCHGIEQYTAPITKFAATFFDAVLRASGLSDLPPAEPARFKGRIKSMAALREAVVRRNDYLNPKMTPQEIEDVVAYLNVTYYRFQR